MTNSEPASTNQPGPPLRAIVAVAATAATLIIVQAAVTRLLSYRLYYHFVFLSISLTLLGMSAASVYVATRRRVLDVDRSTCKWTLAFLAAVPTVYCLMAHPPIPGFAQFPMKLSHDAAVYSIIWYSILLVALNFCGGVILAQLLTQYRANIGQLYGTDLISAAVGCVLALAMMKAFSPPAAFLGSALLQVVPAVLYGRVVWKGGTSRRLANGLTAATLAGIAWIALGPGNIMQFSPPGRNLRSLKHEWNHLFRTDHLPGFYMLDQDASTVTTVWSAKEASDPIESPALAIGGPGADVAIIGSGGGTQVADARRAKARSILAVDINPSIMQWVLEEDSVANNGLFLAENIETRVGEGRYILRSSGRTFDAILIHAIDTYSASAGGAYALTENFLYTKEAVSDYLSVLNDDGLVSFSRWMFYPPREDLRLFITALEALKHGGVAHPENQVIMIAPVSDYRSLVGTKAWGHLLVAKKPFSASAIATLRTFGQRPARC